MKDLIYFAALSSVEYIGARRFEKIRNHFGNIQNYISLSVKDRIDFLGIKPTPELINKFSNMQEKGEKIVEFCEKTGIGIITIEDPAYPPKLKYIPDPPFVLYTKGILNYSIKLVAIVGTRKASPDAASINQYFSRELISFNIGIVSGMAKGHDTIAQQTAVESEGYTIAILGCGVERAYPPSAKNLYERICATGAVISEYPPGAASMPYNFPLRNRIISGLSDAVLVIQAPEKSGALITAKYAEAQGKDLYAIPGNPTDQLYSGTNKLIQNGAKIATRPEDLVLDIFGKKIERKEKPIPAGSAEIKLSGEENIILHNLSVETHFEDLIASTRIEPSRLNHLLTLMEIRGLIIQHPGRFYVRRKI